MQHVVLVRAHAVRHGFSASKLAFGFHIDMHFFERAQSRIQSNSHRQRVIHRRTGVSALLAAGQIEVGNLRDKVALWPVGRTEALQDIFA